MKLLLAAATLPEIEPFMKELGLHVGENEYKTHYILILITGVGMVATAFAMGKHLAAEKYDLAVNLGIAGSFDRSIKLGEVVNILHDRFSELGAEDGETFITIDEMGYGEQCMLPQPFVINPQLITLKQATAITVNTVHGNETSIAKIIARFNPQTESMEGAAFFYACNRANLPCAQVRAISNYVERRNRDSWEIGLAIKNLNIFAVELISKLTG